MKDQYMFLTTKIPSPTGVHSHRVGVVAVRQLPNGTFRTASTIVSRSEPFIAKKGVAKAVGRLDSATFNPHGHTFDFTINEFDTFGGLKGICRLSGLKSDHNWFKRIDWVEADRKFKETFFPRIQHDHNSADAAGTSGS